MKITIIDDKYWNWKLEYKGKPYGISHNYHGQTMEQLEKTAKREWQHDLDLMDKWRKEGKLVEADTLL